MARVRFVRDADAGQPGVVGVELPGRQVRQLPGVQQGGQQRPAQLAAEVAVVTAPAEIATRLGLAEGTLTLVRRRVLYTDGVPVQLSDSYYPADLAEGTELAQPTKLRGYTFAALQRLGIELDHFQDELHTRMPTPADGPRGELCGGTESLHVHTDLGQLVAWEGWTARYAVVPAAEDLRPRNGEAEDPLAR